jgi:adenylate kinase
MDAGDLVPDEVIIAVIAERVHSEEASDGFILDGFPRTVPQAEALDEAMEKLGREITAVILIDARQEVTRRLGSRRTCRENGHVFHVDQPRRRRASCDVDGSELTCAQRRRDLPRQTKPLVKLYEKRGILQRWTAAPAREVTDNIRGLLATRGVKK